MHLYFITFVHGFLPESSTDIWIEQKGNSPGLIFFRLDSIFLVVVASCVLAFKRPVLYHFSDAHFSSLTPDAAALIIKKI